MKLCKRRRCLLILYKACIILLFYTSSSCHFLKNDLSIFEASEMTTVDCTKGNINKKIQEDATNSTHLPKEDITRLVSERFLTFNVNTIDVNTVEWKRFRKDVYKLNQMCSQIDQSKFAAAQQHYQGSQFCGDDVSRTSADSSIFLPQLSTSNRIMKNSAGRNQYSKTASANNSLSKARKPIQFGGV